MFWLRLIRFTLDVRFRCFLSVSYIKCKPNDGWSCSPTVVFNDLCAEIWITRSTTYTVWRLTLLISMVDIEQGKVVTIDVSKPHLGLICLLPCIRGTHEYLWNWRRDQINKDQLDEEDIIMHPSLHPIPSSLPPLPLLPFPPPTPPHTLPSSSSSLPSFLLYSNTYLTTWQW